MPYLVKAHLVFVMLFSLCACQSPQSKTENLAQHQGFSRATMSVNGFELLIYKHKLGQSTKTLNVYLEGDGSPWRFKYFVMADPTSREPLMLKLMALDPQASVYLSRPCYNGRATDPGCSPKLWTSARYSPTVVDSMAAALRVLVERYGVSQVRLIGHSGGGALAMLLAETHPKVDTVVTLAGNLDITAWTLVHGYTPLHSSLNPAKREPLSKSITQWHLLGSADQVIPVQIIKPVVLRQNNAWGFTFSGFTHGCCWFDVWPSVLRAVEKHQPQLIPGEEFKAPPAAFLDRH